MDDIKKNQLELLPLKHVLQSYTKAKLDHMRRVWNVKRISHFNKADLIDALTIAVPQMIEHHSRVWDLDLLQIAKKMVANNGMIKSEEISMENISYLLDHAIIYEIENGNQFLMPHEVMVSFQGLIDHLEVHRIAKRNQEWHQLTLGMLHYYGTLQVSQLIDLIASYTDYPTEMDDYISVIFEARAFHADLIFDQYGFSDLLVLNPSWVAQEHKKRPDIPFYPFSKQAILKASDDAFVDRNKHYRSFVKFLTENYEIDHEDADEIVSECVVDIKLGLNPPDLVSRLSERFEFTSFAEVQPFMDQVMGLFNNTREWILKGHTSMELRPQEDKHLQPLPGEKAVNKPSVTSKKIGRNDSCPCGSGKKYKKCCGK